MNTFFSYSPLKYKNSNKLKTKKITPSLGHHFFKCIYCKKICCCIDIFSQ